MEYTKNLNTKECYKQLNEFLDSIKYARDLQSRYGDVTLSEVRSFIAKDLQEFINDHPEYNIESLI
jgi:Zn-finger domain-containing protein